MDPTKTPTNTPPEKILQGGAALSTERKGPFVMRMGRTTLPTTIKSRDIRKQSEFEITNSDPTFFEKTSEKTSNFNLSTYLTSKLADVTTLKGFRTVAVNLDRSTQSGGKFDKEALLFLNAVVLTPKNNVAGVTLLQLAENLSLLITRKNSDDMRKLYEIFLEEEKVATKPLLISKDAELETKGRFKKFIIQTLNEEAMSELSLGETIKALKKDTTEPTVDRGEYLKLLEATFEKVKTTFTSELETLANKGFEENKERSLGNTKNVSVKEEVLEILRTPSSDTETRLGTKPLESVVSREIAMPQTDTSTHTREFENTVAESLNTVPAELIPETVTLQYNPKEDGQAVTTSTMETLSTPDLTMMPPVHEDTQLNKILQTKNTDEVIVVLAQGDKERVLSLKEIRNVLKVTEGIGAESAETSSLGDKFLKAVITYRPELKALLNNADIAHHIIKIFDNELINDLKNAPKLANPLNPAELEIQNRENIIKAEKGLSALRALKGVKEWGKNIIEKTVEGFSEVKKKIAGMKDEISRTFENMKPVKKTENFLLALVATAQGSGSSLVIIAFASVMREKTGALSLMNDLFTMEKKALGETKQKRAGVVAMSAVTKMLAIGAFLGAFGGLLGDDSIKNERSERFFADSTAADVALAGAPASMITDTLTFAGKSSADDHFSRDGLLESARAQDSASDTIAEVVTFNKTAVSEKQEGIEGLTIVKAGESMTGIVRTIAKRILPDLTGSNQEAVVNHTIAIMQKNMVDYTNEKGLSLRAVHVGNTFFTPAIENTVRRLALEIIQNPNLALSQKDWKAVLGNNGESKAQNSRASDSTDTNGSVGNPPTDAKNTENTVLKTHNIEQSALEADINSKIDDIFRDDAFTFWVKKICELENTDTVETYFKNFATKKVESFDDKGIKTDERREKTTVGEVRVNLNGENVPTVIQKEMASFLKWAEIYGGKNENSYFIDMLEAVKKGVDAAREGAENTKNQTQ